MFILRIQRSRVFLHMHYTGIFQHLEIIFFPFFSSLFLGFTFCNVFQEKLHISDKNGSSYKTIKVFLIVFEYQDII